MEFKSIHPLKALTHFDGRNGEKVAILSPYFSELAWMGYRLRVMSAYIIFLIEEGVIPNQNAGLNQIRDDSFSNLTVGDGERIWELEKITNHDLRALELFFKEKLKTVNLGELSPYVNLGIGAEDINNVALRLSIREAWRKVLLPAIRELLVALITFCEPLISVPLLARTHGQPASVTTFGKEMALFIQRLTSEFEIFRYLEFKPKFSGEVGNANSLVYLLTKQDWSEMERKFLKELGFTRIAPGTQIPPYDDIIQFFNILCRINRILVGFCRDIWQYASFGYLTIENVRGESGSTGMPHKINPQYFEGAEGGLEFANSMFEFFAHKLALNRLQRDFSDSTVRRNFVIPFAYSLLSYQSLVTGIKRVQVNKIRLAEDLYHHWEVLSETLTTALKLSGRDDAHDLVKEVLRGKTIDQRTWKKLIRNLPLSERYQKKLLILTPDQLTGDSESIAKRIIKNAKKELSL